MTDPTTAAGRALVEDEPRVVTGEHSMLTRVLAIEAEAAAPYREALERLVLCHEQMRGEDSRCDRYEEARALLRREVPRIVPDGFPSHVIGDEATALAHTERREVGE
jgi:hypothetical protein